MGVHIEQDYLRMAKLSVEDFLVEIAAHLYNIGKLTLGQARKLAKLDQISFQKELSKRDILIKYEEEDLLDDLASIQAYKDISSQ